MDIDSNNKPQLNPFTFPVGTNIRFLLLVIADLTLTFNSGLMLADPFNLPSIRDL